MDLSTDEQRRPADQRSATLGLNSGEASGGVAPQSQNASAMLLRRPPPPTKLAHPFPIHEMRLRSSTLNYCFT